jgi:hypothetical protein
MNYVARFEEELTRELDDCDEELIKLYSLLGLVLGVNVTLQDVHDAWAVWKNETTPEHRSLVPFGELTPEVQELDRKYMDAIHRVHGRLR